ncbi:MAG: ATP synthase F1 subunit delta [Deltaproteobacteria bacterium]|nr:ATP synthase F1 subunit delta [Deltaproteobacteria bacterium]
MQEGTIGRRYARALALALSEKAGPDGRDGDARFTAVEEQLSAVGALLDKRTGHTGFRQAMLNPGFSVEQRKKVLGEIGKEHKFDEATTSFLTLLVDKSRLPHLPSIARSFRNEVDARIGRVRATIVTAKPLAAKDLAAIIAGLEKKTGKKVVPDVEVDASVIAGVQARIGGLVYDATVRAQLDRLKTEFNVQ